ncbi:SURF1 family-domain-containing protein [Radiomyces spectabilis]|uniref:SURF1 family-domain-containing protein n=1 Tax=Radiomyces spectabilis TaxID=64574 RepID=UPI00221EF74A|nr:SURF1 family-domain-containing protein [Radiomyces spectabilis]KAI8374131.1 SURF1 family-domain-containing protein [Radiomyces spectabilis]
MMLRRLCTVSAAVRPQIFRSQRFMSTETVKEVYTPKQRRFGVGTAFMCTLPFIAFGLGTWQVQRLRWKVNLIQNLEERMDMPPIPLPRRINEDTVKDYEYRRVAVTGHYRHDKEMLLGPRTRGDGNVGYFIITPLERKNGTSVLVKRGWVSTAKKDQRARPESLEEDEVEVEGLLRMSERRNTFTPDNAPSSNQWYWTDVETMAQLTGSEPLLVERVSDQSPYVEHALIDRGIPVGRSPVVEVHNSHLQYIFTWYALSIATSAMLWKLLRKPAHRPKVVKRL